MSDAAAAGQRAVLTAERERVTNELEAIGIDSGTNDSGFADSGQVTAERGEVDALVGSLRDTLSDVDDALAKIDAGTYGVVRAVCRGRSATRGSRRCPRLACASRARRLAADRDSTVHITQLTVIYFFALIAAIILHEISHGVVALWFGDDTARRAGRLTLNPVPHIDPFGSIILPAIGALAGIPGDRMGQAGARESEPAAQSAARHVGGLARGPGDEPRC